MTLKRLSVPKLQACCFPQAIIGVVQLREVTRNPSLKILTNQACRSYPCSGFPMSLVLERHAPACLVELRTSNPIVRADLRDPKFKSFETQAPTVGRSLPYGDCGAVEMQKSWSVCRVSGMTDSSFRNASDRFVRHIFGQTTDDASTPDVSAACGRPVLVGHAPACLIQL